MNQKPGHGYVQFEKQAMRAHRELIRKTPIGAEILDLIIEYMDDNNALVASQATIAEVLDVNQSTVSRAVQILIKNDWLQRIKVGNASAFVVNSGVFWQQARNKRHYSIFKATVLASSTEQSESIEELSNLKLKKMSIKKRIMQSKPEPERDHKTIDLINGKADEEI